MTKYEPSSRNNPCPVCGRGGPNSDKKGGDCRILEEGNVVLCHTYTTGDDDTNGYKFIRTSSKGAEWGVWIWAKPSENGKINGRKSRPKLEQRQYFEYPDREGNNLIRVVRQKGSEVEFYQEYFVDGQWLSASHVNDITKATMRKAVPIYRYHEVRAAVDRGDQVFWVEGETAANALWSIGIAATTSIAGSKGYRRWGSYKDDLKGAKLILCPDRDKAGLAYIDEVAKDFPNHKIYKVFPKSPIWEFLPDAGGLDIADEIEYGATAESILAAVPSEEKEANGVLDYSSVLDAIDKLEVQFEDEQELDWHIRGFIAENNLRAKGYSASGLLKMARARRDGERAIELIDAIDILNSDGEGRRWIIPGLIPLGSTIVFAAQGGAGKTSCVYNFAKHIALGHPWSGVPVMQGSVLIVQTDEPRLDIQDKLEIGRYDEVPRGLVQFITKWRFSQVKQLEQVIKKMRPVLVVIDSYTAAHAGMGAELTKSSAGDNIYTLRDIAQDYECSFVIIHHHNKLHELRDSSTINDNASEIWSLAHDEKVSTNRNHLVLNITKSRSGVAGQYLFRRDPFDYSWENCGPVDGADLKVLDVMRCLESAYPETLTATTVGNRVGLPTHDAHAALEFARRLGLVRSDWVKWTSQEGEPTRFRKYWAHSEGLPMNSKKQHLERLINRPAEDEGVDF